MKKYWRSIEEEEAESKICFQRERKLREKILANFPGDIEATLSISDMGKTCIRAFIYLPEDAPEEVTNKAKKFLIKMYGKAERDFRENQGTFMWLGKNEGVKDSDGKYEERIMIENANPGKCRIRKVKKTIEVFETNCKPEGIKKK